LGACSAADDDAGDSASYGTVADLATDVVAAGFDCELEYEGLEDPLREFSACEVDGTLLTLTVWKSPDDAAALLDAADGTTLVGANWSIQVPDDELRATLQTKLGGATGQ